MDIVQRIFQNFGATRSPERGSPGGAVCVDVPRAVERVADEVSPKLRSIPRYARVLEGPVETTFHYIDRIAEATPAAIPCRRSTFASDPRINAFFSSPQHLQQVFSQSEEVREVFGGRPDADECWALLCMRKEERTKIGMAAVDGVVRKDVLQRAVNFTDHQLVSPGLSEPEARCALKCCIFRSLLAHIRTKVHAARSRTEELETRLRAFRGRLRRQEAGHKGGGTRADLLEEIATLERKLERVDPRLETTADVLQYLADTLSNPGAFITSERRRLHLSRMGIRLENGSEEPGYTLDVSEIKVASREPRIGAMVRFPRDELLPREDFLKKANLFLSI